MSAAIKYVYFGEMKFVYNLDGVRLTTVEVARIFGKRHDHVIRDVEQLIADGHKYSRMPAKVNGPSIGGVESGGLPSTGESNPLKSGGSTERLEAFSVGDLHLDVDTIKADAKASISYFAKAEYKNEQGKMQPMYMMNYKGFMLLTLAYKGERAAHLRRRFIQAFDKLLKSWKEDKRKWDAKVDGNRMAQSVQLSDAERYLDPKSVRKIAGYVGMRKMSREEILDRLYDELGEV